MPDIKLTKCIESSATFLKLINTSKEERKKDLRNATQGRRKNSHKI